MNHMILTVTSISAYCNNSCSLNLNLLSLIFISDSLCQTLSLTLMLIIICFFMTSTQWAATLNITWLILRLVTASSLSQLLWLYCIWRRMRYLNEYEVYVSYSIYHWHWYLNYVKIDFDCTICLTCLRNSAIYYIKVSLFSMSFVTVNYLQHFKHKVFINTIDDMYTSNWLSNIKFFT